MGTALVSASVVLAALVGLVVATGSVRVVPEYQRLVVFRMGRCVGQRGPGLVLLLPFLDRAQQVDLREMYIEVPQQTCITKDNAPVTIDFLIYMRVVDPVLSIVQVVDFSGAAQGIATTTLRAVIGEILLDDVLAKREEINRLLRTKLDEVTERWGVKVTNVEIREIAPPQEIQEAMSRQMSAERNRRAMVTEADGQREAAVKVAQGDRESAILRAQGEREAAVLRAEGYALALEAVYRVAQALDEKTLSLQYLDAIKTLGTGQATKIVVPVEFTALLRPFLDNLGRNATAAGDSRGPSTT